MRDKFLLLALFAVCLGGSGCDFLNRIGVKPKQKEGIGTGPIADLPSEKFVSYLNTQAAHLQSVRYDDVSLKVTDENGELPRLNEGTLVCSRPRNFRVISGHILTSGTEADVGSNDREFWMYVKRPQQTFVYCSHEDFARGKASLPVPFEPAWVLEALGMSTYDPNAQYAIDANQKERVYFLSFDAKTPNGEAVRKTIVFAGDRAGGDRPQVMKHVVQDANRKTVATAEVKEVRNVTTTDPTGGQPVTVQIPTRVVLEWPQQKFKMEMVLGRAKVNETLPQKDFDYFFTRPDIRGANPINLADTRSSGFGTARGQVR